MRESLFAMLFSGYSGLCNAIGHVTHPSQSHDAVIHGYDDVGNVIETHEQKGDFK